MHGQVTPQREATIPVTLIDAAGAQILLRAVVDTGFTGTASLPLAVVVSAGLRRRGTERAALADGSVVLLAVYEATVLWHGRPIQVEVYASGAEPLVGMALLHGSDLHIEVIDGGAVTITPLTP